MTTMRILYGYPWYPSVEYGNVQNLELGYIRLLREAGYDVDGFCLSLHPPAYALKFPQLDALWRKRDRKLLRLYDDLLQKLEKFDVLINAAGINLHPEFVETLPVVTVFGCNDDPESSERLSRPVAAAYDLCLVGNIAEVETYMRWGAKKAIWHPLGLRQPMASADIALSREQILSGERDINIFMMAERQSPWRRSRFNVLEQAFPDGYFFGAGWKKGYLPRGQEQKWLQRTKIGPNIHNSTGPINFRTFYLPANGVLQICDNKRYLGEIFDLGEEVAGFDTIAECVDLCRYYLAHDEERRRVAANGWKRVMRDYTEEKVFERAVRAIIPIWMQKKNMPQKDPLPPLVSRNHVIRSTYDVFDALRKTLRHIRKRLKKRTREIFSPVRKVSRLFRPMTCPAKSFAPIGPGGIRIICYEDVDAWVLGKFAKRMQKELVDMGRKADIAKTGDPTAAIGHHIIYYDAEKKWAPIETFMITHLDSENKISKVRKQLGVYDMGICMSSETREKLVALGMPADKLCYVNPAHDGVIKPRPIVLGIASRTYKDGRKNEDVIMEVFQHLPKDGFTIKIIGAGWDEQVQRLRGSGCDVVYQNKFDYDEYISSFISSLDYLIYFSHDEGSLSFLDAIAADVKTIVTPQGYHLDLPGAIDYPIDTPADIEQILLRIYEERTRRVSRVSSWNWTEYTLRHMAIWDYLAAFHSAGYKQEWDSFLQMLDASGKKMVNEAFRESSVPSVKVYQEIINNAIAGGFSKVKVQLQRGRDIFYPPLVP